MTAYIKRPFFRKIFFLYAGIMISFFLVFSAVIFQQIAERNRMLLEKECHSRIELLSQVLDEKFTELEKIGTQLASCNWVIRARSKSDIIFSKLDLLERREIYQQMGSLNSIARINKTTALLLPQKNMAVDRISFWEMDRYFSSVGLATHEIMPNLLEQLPATFNSLTLFTSKELADSEAEDFILFKQLDFSNPVELVMFFNIDGKEFEKLILNNSKDDIFSFQIIQQDNPIFTMQGKNLPNINIYSETYPSDLYNWSYSFEMPANLAVTWDTMLLLILAVSLSIIVGIVLAFILARTSYKPISTLRNKLGTNTMDDNENEFTAIERSFHLLREENQGLEQLSFQYYNMARNNLLITLLHGSFELNATNLNLDRFEVPFTEEMYYLVAQLDYPESEDSKQRALDYVELSAFGEKNRFHVQLIESMDQQLILILNSIEQQTLFHSVNQYKDYCKKTLGSDVSFFCGLPHKGLIGISKSYQTAKEQALCLNMPYQNSYYYPIDWEIQLINLLRVGNDVAVQKIIDELQAENEHRMLSRADNAYVSTLVFETLLRVEADMKLTVGDVRDEFLRLLESEDKIWPWDYLKGFGEVLCKRADFFKDESSFEAGTQIIAYVDEFFCDSSLSQQVIAEKFRISRSAVSKIFKNSAKVNFIDYLHLLRIQKAKKYFDAGETDIISVAHKTGYENEITFKRAFLRTESLTPRKYVQLCRK